MSLKQRRSIVKILLVAFVVQTGFFNFLTQEAYAVAPPRRPILASPAPGATGVPVYGPFKMSATASSSYVQFVQTIYQNEAGTQVVQTNSETSTPTGWTGMDASSSNAYVSGAVTGTAATFNAPAGLTASTTYYWGAQTIDPDGGGGVSTSSLTLLPNPAWAATTVMNHSVDQTAVATYNGYLYSLGGNLGGGTATATVQYAQINSDGSVGSWTDTTSMSSNHQDFPAVAYNGYLYELGGAPSNGGTATSTVQYAPINPNGSVGAWANTTALTTSTKDLSAFAYQGYLYELAGTTSTVQYAPINLNGTIGTWTNTTALPFSDNDAAVVAYNGDAYVMGGSTTTTYYASINSDGTIGSWTATTVYGPPPGKRIVSGAVSNGYIYAVAGYGASPATSTLIYSPINSDGSIGSWTDTNALVSLSAAAPYPATVAPISNGYIYILGGSTSFVNNTTNAVSYARINEKGRIADEGWRTNTALPSGYTRMGTVAYNGYLYQLGGDVGGATATSTVRYASVNTNGTIGSWTNTTQLAGSYESTPALVYNGKIYFVGGGGGAGISTSSIIYATVNADGSLGSWTFAGALPVGLRFHSAALYNNAIYVVGGQDTVSFGVTSTVEYASINSDGTIGTFTTTTAIPGGRVHQISAAYNGYLYILGGSNSVVTTVNATSSVEYAPINSSGSVGAWANTSVLPANSNDISGGLYNGYLYVVGGRPSENSFNLAATATVLYAPILPASVGSGHYKPQHLQEQLRSVCSRQQSMNRWCLSSFSALDRP